MRTTISKWGNNLALRLPRHVADEAGLIEGSTVKVEVEDGVIKVTPTRKRFRLGELLQGHALSAEFDWGRPTEQEDIAGRR